MTQYLSVSAIRRPYLLASLVFACSGLVASGCGSDDDSGTPAGGSGGQSAAGSAGHAGGSMEAPAGAGGVAGAAGSTGAAEAGSAGAAVTAAFAVTRTDLDSDQAGAAVTDANLLNAWGIAINPTAEVFWVSSNHGGSTPVYDATGAIKPVDPKVPPLTGTDPGSPTGQIFNGGTNFMGDKFVVDTEDGQILGWPGTGDFVKRAAKTDAVYKGLAVVGAAATQMLVATDFHNGTVDLYGPAYAAVTKAGAFVDATIPTGFAPFNVMPIGDKVYVTYAKQDADKADDESGVGNGYVSVFATDGTYDKTLISGGVLNSPWAVALAPASFGALASTLLIGNFGDGAVHAFDPDNGALVGALTNAAGNPLIILGLWDLKVGPTGTTDLSNTLFFTAGPAAEAHGVFGKLEAATTN
jgi:uncharacterized protein (TIGR03118 family)